ncbi:MAG: hypothetical protein GYB67_04780 [Chloroflexi bacterium]|nr:hypothetical protein [Chloroflexota bacterium]
MQYHIDPTFSVYRLIERVESGSMLVNQRRTMSLVSHEIEDASLHAKTPTRIFAGFQYYSRFMRQVKRYTRLAEKAESIYVFGVPDVETPSIENLHYIRLRPDDHLVNEWFVVSYGAHYFSALATRETTDITMPDRERRFEGVWTFDPNMVSILTEWLTSTVDAYPLPVQTHDYKAESDALSRSILRLTNHMEKLPQGDERLVELTTIIHKQLRPALISIV